MRRGGNRKEGTASVLVSCYRATHPESKRCLKPGHPCEPISGTARTLFSAVFKIPCNRLSHGDGHSAWGALAGVRVLSGSLG